MIVNTAYAYMGKAEPATPKLWDIGEVYVPYTLAGGATWDPSTGYFSLPSDSAANPASVTLTINAKGYSKISVRANRRSSSTADVTFQFERGGVILGTVQQNVDNYLTTYQIAIPEAARIAGVKLKIFKKTPSSVVTNLVAPATMVA